MSHMMNGKPIWCPPARTHDNSLPVVIEPEPTLTLREAAALVRAAIKQGLIKLPDPQAATVDIGPNSVLAPCQRCGADFPRWHSSTQTLCKVCRLEEKNCIMCGCFFQPKQKKQRCCSARCRQDQLVKIGALLRKERPIIACAACGKPFERRIASQTNCSRECGFESMSRKAKLKAKSK